LLVIKYAAIFGWLDSNLTNHRTAAFTKHQFPYIISELINRLRMKTTRKNLSASQVELKINLTQEDLKPHMAEAARHISQHLNVPGFRPGKAPYDIVKREVGEEQIFQESLDDAINSALIKAMQEESIYPYGEPDLKLDKITPLQGIDFTVTMDVYPEVTLGAWPTEKIKRHKPEASKEEIDNAIKDLAKMLVKEELVEREAKTGDSAYVDFDVLVNGVPIEGGSAKDFAIVIGEGKMIPGFEDQMVGMKAGETRDFRLTFPKDYAPQLAGKEADFKIGMKQVLERVAPATNDELAKRVGVKDLAELQEKMKENIQKEKEGKDRQRAEIEAVKKVVEAATITEIPKKMVHDEIHRLIHEFEHDLARQGINLQTYLGQTGKKKEDMEKEFEPKAIERLKTSLVVDQIAEQEKLEVDQKEVDKEWDKQKQFYSNQPDTLAEVSRPEYRNHLRNRMLKIKAIELINSRLVE
jgi:trigger factor